MNKYKLIFEEYNKVHQKGQALVGGLILIIIVLFFCAYFLSVSESYFRLFSNSEKAHANIVTETSRYANILNQISINNQNIIAALSVSENALLKAIEYGIYIGFHQPYWKRGLSLPISSAGGTAEMSEAGLSQDTTSIVSSVFKSYALTSARGFYLAKSLAEKNNSLLKKLPVKMQTYFVQSSNAEVLCFALAAEDKYYHSPGMLNLPVLKIYNFYLNRAGKNKCAIENKISKINKFLEFSLPVLFTSEKEHILDYSQLNNLSFSENYSYGILYVIPKNINNFRKSLVFLSASSVTDSDKKFWIIEKFLSRLAFFKDIHLGEEKNMLKSPLQNSFFITHKYIYCSLNSICSTSGEQVVRSFFTPYWAVTGVYE